MIGKAMTSTPEPSKQGSIANNTDDPVRQRRQLIDRWTRLAKRIGYLSFGVSIVAVFTGLATSFTPLVGQLATSGLVIGSILLAPSIVLGYAIKAAEKEDRLNGN
jgi:ABC-type uncharacterized transport system permease subunit